MLLAACGACLASRKLGSGRHHSPRNQAIEFARPRFKLLPAPESSPCTSLKTTSPSASHPACFFACLPIAIASYSSSIILQPQHHQPPHNLKMKASIALLAVGASFAIAQSISDLPPCGVSLYSLYTPSLHNFKLDRFLSSSPIACHHTRPQANRYSLQQTCVNNMINIATSQFGCTAGDVKCYCTNQNFGYGIRDCSNESCSPSDAAKVISFGTAYCAG